jgi:hypothetical protein
MKMSTASRWRVRVREWETEKWITDIKMEMEIKFENEY